MERVRRARAVGRRIGERLDDLQLLDDRARPSVRDDQRQRVLVPGADVDEVNVKPVDLGYEIRQGVQFRLALAPVIVRPPVARELLHHRERYALRVVGDRLTLGPPGRVYASAQLGKLRLRKTDLKRANSSGVAARLLRALSHGYVSPSCDKTPLVPSTMLMWRSCPCWPWRRVARTRVSAWSIPWLLTGKATRWTALRGRLLGVAAGQKPSMSTIAWAKACGASWGRLCPTPPSITRCAYLPENLPA